MGSAKSIFDGVKWTYLNTIITSVFGFISVPLLLNYFGKSDFGLITLATSLNVYLGLMDLGVSGTTVRFFSNWLAKGEQDKVKKLFSTTIFFLGCVGLINTIILGVFSIYCDRMFALDSDQVSILRHLIMILGLNAFFSWSTSPFDQLIRSSENIAWLQKRSLFPITCQILILILTLTLHLTLEFYFFASTFSYLFIIPFTVRKIKSLFPYISFKPKFSKVIFSEIVSYSISIASFGIFQFSMLNLRPVILGMQADIESVSDYKVMGGIVGMVLTISSCFFGILLPSSSKAVAQGNKDAINRIVFDGTKYITIVLGLMIFGGLTIGDKLLYIYVGESFSHISIWLYVWLASLFVQHNQAISSIIFAGTNVKPIAYMSAVSTVIGLTLCWFLTPTYKVGGVVIGYFVYCVFQTLFYYIYYWPRVLNINSFMVFRKCLFPVLLWGGLSVVLARCILSYFDCKATIMFLIGGSTFVLLYVIAVYMFILNQSDCSFFLNLIKRH